MKTGGIVSGFDVSARGLSVQRKKMNLIAENIANADSVRAENGQPYRRQFLQVEHQGGFVSQLNIEGDKMRLNISNKNHFASAGSINEPGSSSADSINTEVMEDKTKGEVVFMPNHPDADEQGYVELSNVNVITEMVEMIAASRSYEANLTAFNSSKQMAKDALEI